LHADWRSGATSAGSRRGDDEDTCRSHGRKVVTRWSSIRYGQCSVRWGRSIELNHCTAQSTQKNSNNQTMICSIMHNTSAINLNERIRRNPIGRQA
jgi:hypothetical protein